MRPPRAAVAYTLSHWLACTYSALASTRTHAHTGSHACQQHTRTHARTHTHTHARAHLDSDGQEGARRADCPVRRHHCARWVCTKHLTTNDDRVVTKCPWLRRDVVASLRITDTVPLNLPPHSSGKSTLVQVVKLLLRELYKVGRVEEVSQDDFLSSQEERLRQGGCVCVRVRACAYVHVRARAFTCNVLLCPPYLPPTPPSSKKIKQASRPGGTGTARTRALQPLCWSHS